MHLSLDYYAQQSAVTDPGGVGSLIPGLPEEIGALCRIVQGMMIHPFEAHH